MSHYWGKAKGIIETILTAPLVLPPTVVGFLLLASNRNRKGDRFWQQATGIPTSP